MLDANSELAQGYLIDTLLKYLKKSKSISLLMKMRGRSTATSLQLLATDCWRTILQNIELFMEMHHIIIEIMKALSPEDLASVAGAKLVEVHDCINTAPLQEIHNIATNMMDLGDQDKDQEKGRINRSCPKIKSGVCDDLDRLKAQNDQLDE